MTELTPVRVRLWLFWLPFLLGSGALAFAVLLAQVPGRERTFDCIVFSVATALLAGSLWLGFFHSSAPYGRVSGWARPVLLVLAGTEVLLAVFGAISASTYRGL
jgi:hypothetical protein